VHERAAAPDGGVVKTATTRALLLLAGVPLLCAFEPLRSQNREVEQGNAAMQAGKAEDALKHYDAAVGQIPADAGAHFDRGTALYALSRFDEAGQEFLRATEAKEGPLKESAFYNLGNAFFKKDKFKEAIEAYKRALALDPRDQRAKWNLEIALRKQKDEDEKNKDKDKDKDKKDDKKKDDQKKDDTKKDDKKKDDKDKQSDKDKDKQNKPEDNKDKNDKPQPQQTDKPDEKQIEAVLDSLEKSPKDLEKERARLRAVRRQPPARDW
jgi:tetratricopeptide (TPR) repeat protein